MTEIRPSLPTRLPPPTKHQLAFMIWIAVVPTLTALNLGLRDVLGDLPLVLRTLVLSTAAVPIVIYGLMPHLHRLRAHVLTRRPGVHDATSSETTEPLSTRPATAA